MIARDVAAVALFIAAGLVLGTAYFASLRHGVRASVMRQAWMPYVLLALARVAAATLFFAWAVSWGIPALLGTFAGFLLARQLAVHAAGKVA
jgi:hypothetical protein